jgi:hypothetical protein
VVWTLLIVLFGLLPAAVNRLKGRDLPATAGAVSSGLLLLIVWVGWGASGGMGIVVMLAVPPLVLMMLVSGLSAPRLALPTSWWARTRYDEATLLRADLASSPDVRDLSQLRAGTDATPHSNRRRSKRAAPPEDVG